MPLLVSVQKRYADRGVVVIGASADDESTRAQIAPFRAEARDYVSDLDRRDNGAHEVARHGTGLPVTAIVDQQGRLAFRLLGVLKRGELVKRIDYLLGRALGRRRLRWSIESSQKTRRSHAAGEENHSHGGVGMEGASTVPS
jgi:hypothetical protein